MKQVLRTLVPLIAFGWLASMQRTFVAAFFRPISALVLCDETKTDGRLWRLICVSIVAAFVGIGMPDSAFAVTVFSGSLDASSPTMTDRILRDAVASTCAAIKAYPGTAIMGSGIQYQTAQYTHPGAPRCVTFTYSSTCTGEPAPGTFAFLSVYSGPFDPNNKATNYLGDIGTSTNGQTMGVVLATGQTVTLVVNGIYAALNCTFSINSDEVPAPPKNTHDLNGDGKSDILWKDTSGNTAAWLMNGGQILQAGGFGTVPDWSVVGQRDFNGDGKYDLLWRDGSGNTAIWLLNGLSILQAGGLGNIPTTWSVVGTADFNADGKGDILWKDSSGNVAIWLMNGLQVALTGSVGNVGTSWFVAGTADFNGDGLADILWKDSSGNVAIWLMNVFQILQAGSLGNLGTSWSVAGTGDFNGDGKADILWKDNSGNVAIWLMNGLQVLQAGGLGFVNSLWNVAETGDFNGDGKADILWRDGIGNTAIWFMNDLQIFSTAGLGNIPTTWTVQGVNAD
jgi:hypothetical protein